MSTLNEFISSVKQSGMANANRFFVEIAGADKKIGLFCDTATLPGTQILSTPARTFGEVREVPYEITYDTVSCSFYIDNDWEVVKFFNDWRTKIFDPTTRTGGYYSGPQGYVRDIKIICYNKEDNRTYGVQLYEAYPKQIGAVNLDYNNKDIPKLSVTFQYLNWVPLDAATGSAVNTSKYSAVDQFGTEGLPGGFGGGIDLNNIMGGYFNSSSFGAPQQFLTSFGGFQNTFNSFKGSDSFSFGSVQSFFV